MKNNSALFTPFKLKSLDLKNRIVMAPMTRSFSPDGVPTKDVSDYYRRRAEGEVGLILSEGTVIGRPASSNDQNVPRFHGDKALAGWQDVINQVKAANGMMGPQLWHMGIMQPHASGWMPTAPFEGPSGFVAPGKLGGTAMSEEDIYATIKAFADAALAAKNLGFQTIELHGAHGYLIDQFFWSETNHRTDQYGGKTLVERSRFAVDVIKAVRQAVGPDFAILLRLSQWKPTAYNFKMAETPEAMGSWLQVLADAGVDAFHCSQRRFWEPEFADSELNFAGWAKKLTGKATITVGSIGLSGEFLKAWTDERSSPESFENLIERLEKDEFDLVAVGRPLLTDPDWVKKIKSGQTDELKGFNKSDLKRLY